VIEIQVQYRTAYPTKINDEAKSPPPCLPVDRS
jgi:hypothetical protein